MNKLAQHRFQRYCIDPDKLTHGRTLEAFLHVLKNQSNEEIAVQSYGKGKELTDFAEHETTYRSPLYFGEGGEFLSHCFFEYYKDKYSIENIVSVNCNIANDRGWDREAVTTRNFKWATCGSPVYIQDKTTLNSNKIFRMNDGSRIMNFLGAAAMDAITKGKAQEARFILWTTGKSVHFSVDKVTFDRLEVVNGEMISSLINDNEKFWKFVDMHLKAPSLRSI